MTDAVDAAPVLTNGITLGTFGETYVERVGKPVSANHQSCFRRLVAFTAPGAAITYGARTLGDFTVDDLEVFFAALRAQGFAESTRNKYAQMVKALFRWATKKGYLSRNPAVESDVLTRRKPTQRHRRLDPGEEDALLKHAGPHLQRLIIATLETGCRRGELLSLTWRDVNLDRREMTIRAERTKTKSGRVLPISSRFLAVLQMAQTDPTGKEFGPEAFVFGDVIGRQVKTLKRAWGTAVLKAHGHTPQWAGNHAITAESRAAFEAVNLHFHDLRHEAGSRLLEAGWPLHNVAHMLGHANISQTSTYLNATRIGLQESMRRLDASRCNPIASEAQIDRTPHRNEGTTETAQPLVN